MNGTKFEHCPFLLKPAGVFFLMAFCVLKPGVLGQILRNREAFRLMGVSERLLSNGQGN